jgi:hypothetical protein
MRPLRLAFILVSLLALLACTSSQPTKPAVVSSGITTHVPATQRPIISHPVKQPSSIVPTLTQPLPPPTTMPILTPSTLVPPQTDATTMVPLTPLSAIGPAWTYWRAVDLTQGIRAVTTQGKAVWVGTPYGVYRVDPQTGTYIAYEEVGPVSQLLPTEEGQLWALGTEGVFFFNGQQWGRLNEIGTDLHAFIGIDKRGDLWLLYPDDRFGGMSAAHFTGHVPPGGDWSYDFYRAYQVPLQFNLNVTDCQAWVAVAALYRTAAECEALKAARTLANMPVAAWPALAAIDQADSFWWVTNSGSWDALTFTLHHYRGNAVADRKLPTARIENTTVNQDLGGAQVSALVPDPSHGVWLGTNRGLLYSDGETVRKIPLAQDQPTLRAGPRNIAIDTDGNAWVVTAQGVQKLPAQSSSWQDVHDFGLSRALNGWALGTIAAAREGGIWATHGQDLWRFGGSTSTPLMNPALPDSSCRLLHLAVDQEGNVWSPLGDCTARTIVFKPKTGEWLLDPSDIYPPAQTTWQVANPPDVGSVHDEALGPDGRIWFVGDYGIAVYDPTKDIQP